jgi:hemoglobin/transferrin/lactoferrin receptor protein
LQLIIYLHVIIYNGLLSNFKNTLFFKYQFKFLAQYFYQIFKSFNFKTLLQSLKTFTPILFFLFFYLQGYSQLITIKDQENHKPLELATLSSEKHAALIITDLYGQADISAFKDAAKIEIRMVGYQTIIRSYEQLRRDGFMVYMSASVFSLDQIVISATRWSKPRREVPSRITSISPGEVASMNPQTAADLLGISGEVYIQKSQQGGGSPMIRGFATNRLLITVDGIRMNTAIFRSGNLQNVISLDPFLMDRTEVLFGPGSVIYGSDAIAGVMNFYTLPASLSPDGKLSLSGIAAARFSSANNEITGHFNINVAIKKWAFMTSFSQFNFNDLQMGRNGPDEYLRNVYVQHVNGLDVVSNNDNPRIQRPTGYSQNNLMEKIHFRPNDAMDFSYGFHYSATTNIDRYDRLIRFKKGLPASAEWYYGPQIWIMNNFNLTHSGQHKLYDELIVRVAHQYFQESRVDRDFGDTERRTRIEKVNAFSVNIDLNKSAGDKHKLFYGLEVVYDDVNSSGKNYDIATGITVPGPSRYPQSDWTSLAAYMAWHYNLTEKIIFQAGARYNHFILNARFDTTFYPFPFTTADISKGALTGSIGIVVSPSTSWSLSANLSTGFRSPNVDDIGKIFDSEPGSVVVPNPSLNAEYAWNAEVGIAKIFSDWLKADVTGYYTILDDALVRRDYTLNGMDSIMYDGEMSKVQAIQNAAQARVWGIQSGLEIKLPAGFGVISHFNWQKGEEELDDGSIAPLRHAAPWFGASHLTFSMQKLKLDFYAVYNGEISFKNLPPEEQSKAYIYAVDKNGNPYSPGWYTLNFKCMYQITEQLSINAGIENITSQRYRPYSSGITGPGRNFIVALRAMF